MIRFVDDLLVNILSDNAHSVIEIVQVENQSTVHVLRQSPPYSVVNWVQVRAVWGHADGLINVNKTCFFVYKLHSMCKQFSSV